MTSNLASILIESAQRRHGRPALKLGDAVTTYDQLGAGSALVAGALAAKGVTPGDRVGIMLPNVPDFGLTFYGALRAGAVVVPMNVQLKRREVEFYLGDSGADVLFAWHEVGDALEGARAAGADVLRVGPERLERSLSDATPRDDVAERAGEDTAVIIYTSGTTGTPKGAELTHAGMLKNVEIVARDQLQLTEDDVVLGALPLFHLFGLQVSMNCTVRHGACLTLITRFDAAEALQIIERDRVTVFQGVPTMYHALLNHPDRERYDTSSLRLCQSGGASLPVEVLRGFEAAFGCILIEGYGLSETSPSASCNRPDRERKIGSVGPAVEGVEIRIVDDEDREVPTGEIGEIVIRGHNIMKGYWNRPDATAEVMRGGWFHTGDIGKVDELPKGATGKILKREIEVPEAALE